MATTTELVDYLNQEGLWHEPHGDGFLVSCEAPYEEPEDRSLSTGEVCLVAVRDGQLCWDWSWASNGYDEHKTFQSVLAFANFFDDFITNGADSL